MKKDPSIRYAIDESLSSVRFNAQDERSVLRRVRAQRQEEKPPVRAKKRGLRLDFAFAMGMVLVLVIPLTVFTLHAGSLRTQRIVLLADTNPSVDAPPVKVSETAQPAASAAPVPDSAIDESAAIRAARDCYNAVCDTSIFSFEEFTVTCTLGAPQYPADMEGDAQYTVVMESVYGNGCTFEVYVDAQNGSVLHSNPKYATHPSISALESEKAQAWYKKNGSCILTWQPAAQADSPAATRAQPCARQRTAKSPLLRRQKSPKTPPHPMTQPSVIRCSSASAPRQTEPRDTKSSALPMKSPAMRLPLSLRRRRSERGNRRD